MMTDLATDRTTKEVKQMSIAKAAAGMTNNVNTVRRYSAVELSGKATRIRYTKV